MEFEEYNKFIEIINEAVLNVSKTNGRDILYLLKPHFGIHTEPYPVSKIPSTKKIETLAKKFASDLDSNFKYIGTAKHYTPILSAHERDYPWVYVLETSGGAKNPIILSKIKLDLDSANRLFDESDYSDGTYTYLEKSLIKEWSISKFKKDKTYYHMFFNN